MNRVALFFVACILGGAGGAVGSMAGHSFGKVGLWVGGILLANVLVFFGLFVIPPARAAALPTVAADHVAEFLERVFVDGKFYSTFSLLFGIGFGVQLERGGEAALQRFRRRLRILLGIGA